MGESMHPSYFGVRFRIPQPVKDWPPCFAILSGYATTGEVWTTERNEGADRALGEALKKRGGWLQRITGFFPDTGHAEPGWAAEMTLEEGCTWGGQYLQDAIYWVDGDFLWVSHCDQRRALVPVGRFRERVECTVQDS
jgi:hypothetical protein